MSNHALSMFTVLPRSRAKLTSHQVTCTGWTFTHMMKTSSPAIADRPRRRVGQFWQKGKGILVSKIIKIRQLFLNL